LRRTFLSLPSYEAQILGMRRRVLAAAVLFTLAVCPEGQKAFARQNPNPVIVFVSDGMRQDFMKQFAAEGKMPAYARLLEQGIDAGPGLIPPVPPNSGVAWTTLGTGASPSVSGVTGNNFHDNTQLFTPFGISAWARNANRAQTFPCNVRYAALRIH
jgi:predicted AlkP superfamily pyrophosphatase or phosphodiesterase